MIISDAGPINFLIRIEAAHVLPVLYGQVVLPYDVCQELSNTRAPAEVQHFLLAPPAWLTLSPPQPKLALPGSLHAGELAVLQQASSMPGVSVLIDDRGARLEALRRNVPMIGTIALLYDGGVAGLLDFEECLLRLASLQFRMSERLRTTYLERWRLHIKA